MMCHCVLIGSKQRDNGPVQALNLDVLCAFYWRVLVGGVHGYTSMVLQSSISSARTMRVAGPWKR